MEKQTIYFNIGLVTGAIIMLIGMLFLMALHSSNEDNLLKQAMERGVQKQFEYTNEYYNCYAKIVPPKYESNYTGNLYIGNQSLTEETSLVIGNPNGSETLRINADGSIYHNEKFVGNDSEIPELLKQALKMSLDQ